MNKKLFFLHIPKTAGQSVHQLLLDGFGKEMVCPLREDEQFKDTTLKVENYTVYSGHIDWARLSELEGNHITFTILRKPIDRLLSFYFYLRTEAKKLDPSELPQPHRAGMNSVLSLTPDEYFCTQTGSMRQFIDDHYDNFYMYFFSKRRYTGRRLSKGQSINSIFKQAVVNMLSIDGIYFIDNWADVTELINKKFANFSPKNTDYFVNKGDNLTTEDRILKLKELGPAELAIARIGEMCKYDNILYDFIGKTNSINGLENI